MEPIKVHLETIKVDDYTWDVVILAEEAVLQSFVKVYKDLFYVDESIFNKNPAVIAPNFSNKLQADTWKAYWVRAFADPENACDSCATVHELLELIEEARQNG